MKGPTFYHIIAATLLLITLMACSRPGSCGEQQNTKNLTIIHTNDFHGYLIPYEDRKMAPPPEKTGGAAYIASVIREQKRKNPGRTLVLDGGDIAQGTLLSNEFRGQPVVDYMNAVPFDASTLGNHEFDWGQKVLKNTVKRAHFPFICANVVENESGKPPRFITPFRIFDIDGVRIGVIGLTTPTIPSISYPENIKGLSFLSPEETARQYLPLVKSRGAQIIVILSHLGVEGDRRLAEKVPGIDFIIGGHSHTALKEGIRINETLIAQTGAYGMYVGVVHLSVNTGTGRPEASQAELIPVIDSRITPDSAVEAILARYNEKLEPIIKEVLGYARQDISKTPLPGRGDSPMGSLITDLLKAESQSEIFIYNTGAIRAPLQEGPITREDVYKVIPFDDYLVTLSLTGAQIEEVLHHAIKQEKMVQVAGLSLVVEGFGPEERTLKSVALSDGTPLDRNRSYSTGTINYLYNGGDGYTTFSRGRNPLYGKTLTRELIYEAIRKKDTISPPQDVRFQLIEKTPAGK